MNVNSSFCILRNGCHYFSSLQNCYVSGTLSPAYTMPTPHLEHFQSLLISFDKCCTLLFINVDNMYHFKSLILSRRFNLSLVHFRNTGQQTEDKQCPSNLKIHWIKTSSTVPTHLIFIGSGCSGALTVWVGTAKDVVIQWIFKLEGHWVTFKIKDFKKILHYKRFQHFFAL